MQAPSYYNEGYQTFTHIPEQQNHIQGQSQYDASPFNEFDQNYGQSGGFEDYTTNQMMMQNFNEAQSINVQHQQFYHVQPQQPVIADLYHGQQASINYQEAGFDPNVSGSVIPQNNSMMNFQNGLANQHTPNQFDSFPMISTDYVSDQQRYITPPSSTDPIPQKNYKIAGAQNQFQPQAGPISGFPTIDTYSSIPISPMESPLPSPSSSNMNSSQASDINSSTIQLATPVSPKHPSSGGHFSSPRAGLSVSRRSSMPNSKISKPPVKRNSTLPNLSSSIRSPAHTQHTTQPGPIPATKPTLTIDPNTGEELLMFSYSKRKIINNFTIKCPLIHQKFEEFLSTLPQEFLTDNCVYPRAMTTEEEYKGNRYSYEKECNEVGWNLAWLNPEIREHRGLIQRAVDSWRNTRPDKKLRSRRVRKSELATN